VQAKSTCLPAIHLLGADVSDARSHCAVEHWVTSFVVSIVSKLLKGVRMPVDACQPWKRSF
jgi:hypothetical protein